MSTYDTIKELNGIDDLANAIDTTIEDYEEYLFRMRVFNDLLHLSEEDLARLSSEEQDSVIAMLKELCDIIEIDGDYDNLYEAMEYYEHDAENYIDKATQGKGVRY